MRDKKQTILGIDPGTAITGYGLISIDERRAFRAVDYGSIRPPVSYALSERYRIIFESVDKLLSQHKPDAMAVETQYIQKNPQSAMKLGMARGVIVLAATLQGIPTFEYAPSTAQKAVVGRGNASKAQVLGMVQRLLALASPPSPQDAADALALAICHGQTLSARKKI